MEARLTMPPRPVRDALLAATLAACIVGIAGYALWLAAEWLAG